VLQLLAFLSFSLGFFLHIPSGCFMPGVMLVRKSVGVM